eukprot:CAMPEP_0177611458 /NCGR_PEP_ID=MMETSP0419_2-20121207/20503_1 /TAXON_ID=582737 /ORGANISM="Tetraselmis sp., Strain GSL018" /LENGTH=89 /DNA_ID=CAMNT_0019107191 /DNA_START=482 /DNA_END=751 /DNA_ORIENTATION=-
MRGGLTAAATACRLPDPLWGLRPVLPPVRLPAGARATAPSFSARLRPHVRPGLIAASSYRPPAPALSLPEELFELPLIRTTGRASRAVI